MNTLPIQLNFFKRAEQFLELLSLDEQYDQMMLEWQQELRKKKQDASYQTEFTFPTWNAEKKILYWTYMHHKHLGTPLNTNHFTIDEYLRDWHTDRVETGLCGPRQILENLEAHGFAKFVENSPTTQILINSNGLLAGSLLFSAYHFKNVSYSDNDYTWSKLEAIKRKKLGYRIMYIAAWLLIFISILFVSLQLSSLIGVLDDAKLLVNNSPSSLKIFLFVIVASPALLLLIGMLLIFGKIRKK